MIRMLPAKRLWVAVALATLFAPCAPAQGTDYNVVLITLDTFRPDHLRRYG